MSSGEMHGRCCWHASTRICMRARAYAGDPTARLASYVAVLNDGKCMSVSYEDEVIAPLVNTTVIGGTNRIWTYQV